MTNARLAALNYRWSSYNVYAGKEKNPGWLTTDSIYACFGQQGGRRRRAAYRRQLEHMAGRGNGALPAAWCLARNFAGVRLAELGSGAGET